MTPSISLAMPQKMRGLLFLTAGTFLFVFLLGQIGMFAHLQAILGLAVPTITAIVNAILTGTISSLPATLQAIAAAYASLVVNLIGILGVSGVIAL